MRSERFLSISGATSDCFRPIISSTMGRLSLTYRIILKITHSIGVKTGSFSPRVRLQPQERHVRLSPQLGRALLVDILSGRMSRMLNTFFSRQPQRKRERKTDKIYACYLLHVFVFLFNRFSSTLTDIFATFPRGVYLASKEKFA